MKVNLDEIKFGEDDEEIKFDKIEEEITAVKYDAVLKTLLVWVKDNPYFDKVRYAWLNSEEKVEAFKNLMVKFTGDERYSRKKDTLIYDGIPVSKLEYERDDDKIRLSRY